MDSKTIEGEEQSILELMRWLHKYNKRSWMSAQYIIDATECSSSARGVRRILQSLHKKGLVRKSNKGWAVRQEKLAESIAGVFESVAEEPIEERGISEILVYANNLEKHLENFRVTSELYEVMSGAVREMRETVLSHRVLYRAFHKYIKDVANRSIPWDGTDKEVDDIISKLYNESKNRMKENGEYKE